MLGRTPLGTAAATRTVTTPKLTPTPTQSYWHTRNFKQAPGVELPLLPEQLGRRHAADVCIVGAGIAGASLAYHLTRLDPECTVTLVDGRHLAGAATGRNGGLLWPCLNASFQTVLATKGAEAASDILRFEAAATKQITRFIQDTPGMQELTEYSPYSDGGLILFASEEEARKELLDLSLMREAGFGEELDVWDAVEVNRRLGSRGYFGAIRMPQVGRVWAARLTLGLATEAAKHPARRSSGSGVASSRLTLVEATEVSAIQQLPGEEVPAAGDTAALDRPRDLSVRTSRGDTINCRVVVHCTNAYASGLLPELHGRLVPVRNQVVVTSPLPPRQQIKLDASVYAREGYVYWSPRADGRLVLGGFRDVLPHKEEGTFDDGSLDPQVSRSIRNYLPTHFPELFSGSDAVKFDMEWSGILGFTRDRFPLVGALPEDVSGGAAVNQASRKGQYICAGFSGHGMTRAYSCAEGLARTLLGLPPGEAAVPSAFDADRIM